MRHPMMRDIPFETAVEYAVDFISIIGAPALYDEKTAVVKVSNWRGQLPCDFADIIQVRTAHSSVPKTYRYSTYSFHMSPDKFPVEEATLTYKIQGMVILTSTRNTDLEIAYKAFAVDDEGYPLLPDNANFLRALEDYIKLQWFTILYDMGKINQGVLQNAQQEYSWAVGAATMEFNKLTPDMAESLFNACKTLLPRSNEHWKTFFATGAREQWFGGKPHGLASPTDEYFRFDVDRKPPIDKRPSKPHKPENETSSSELSVPVYYGGQASELSVDEAGSVISGWNHSDTLKTEEIWCGSVWFYIAVPAMCSVKSIISENNERLDDLFVNKGIILIDSKSYNLYEFHLSSDMPLDVNITLTLVKNGNI